MLNSIKAEDAQAPMDNFSKGESMVFTSNVWKVVNYAGEPENAKGIISTIDGTLVIHPVRAYNGATPPVKQWLSMPVKAGIPVGVVFDEVKDTGSTAGLFAAGAMIVML